MNRHAKASSAGTSTRQANGLGRILRGVLATRGASAGSNGSGAPAARGFLLAAAVCAVTVLLGATALAAGIAPSATTQPAQDVAPTHASLQGLVNPNGEASVYWFEYGPTAAYGTSVPASKNALPNANAEVAEGTMNATAIQALYGLTPSTTYHYRLVAKNASGEDQGNDETFTTLPEGAAQSCANEQFRSEQHSSYLPSCRAYEMVSPPDKNGGSVGVEVPHTHAAADGSAIAFMSLTAFGDAIGTGIGTEYMAERNGQAGTTGWSTHAITPAQEPLPLGVATSTGSPLYVGEFSPDLSKAVFRAWSPLTEDPEVAKVQNLYLRDDLRTPGAGSYRLLTACPACNGTPLSASISSGGVRPWMAEASNDFKQVLFESGLDLTGDGAGPVKLYMSDEGSVHLVGVVPAGAEASCGGTGPACVLPSGDGGSIAGLGASVLRRMVNVISEDGSRVNFSAPTNGGFIDQHSSEVYQRDTHGTASSADDTTVLISAPERTLPGGGESGAVYQGASTDGHRVFFQSEQALSDDTPTTSSPHLYMWHDDYLNNEVQKLSVEASGGQFRLLLGGEESADLPFDATATQVAQAIEALPAVAGAGGKISVSGGPGDETGSSPYTITFEGGLAETDEPTMGTAAGTTPLSGGGAAATVSPWVKGEGHLTLIDADHEPADGTDSVEGVIGTSADGSYVYFVSDDQLVAGGPAIPGGAEGRWGVFLWHEGEISYVGAFALTPEDPTSGDSARNTPGSGGIGQRVNDLPSRVSADGKTLLIGAINGSGLTGYDHKATSPKATCKICQELYVYHAASGRLQCASCDLSGRAASDATSWAGGIFSGVPAAAHLTRALSSDGRYVFFTTGQALVAEDTNGVNDAYEFDTQTGEAQLLSSGTDPHPSYFIEASTSGDDAFIATRQALVGWDTDSSYDIYDARIGGGLPEPAAVTAPCSGDACLGAVGPAPGAPGTVSATLQGSGNVKEARKCPKGSRRVKTRCVKQNHRKRHGRHQGNSHNRTANNNRRAGR